MNHKTISSTLHCFSLQAWKRVFNRIVRNCTDLIAYELFLRIFYRTSIPISADSPRLLLIDALWFNYNHFIRLLIFLHSFSASQPIQCIALVPHENHKSIRLLKSLGIRRFIFLSHYPTSPNDRTHAARLLSSVQKHADLLNLRLPYDLPPSIYYDTVLKNARHPQPSLNNPHWEESLAEVFRLTRTYYQILKSYSPSGIIVSHPWKNEFGILVWLATMLDITSYHIYSSYESVRIRKLNTYQDFFNPIEIYPYSIYKSLSTNAKKYLSDSGHAYSTDRQIPGSNSDINHTSVFKHHTSSKPQLNLPSNRFTVVIFCHAWFDFPHSFGMSNYNDFYDWATFILKIAYTNPHINWVFRPHPTDSWYGGFTISDLIQHPPSNVLVSSDSTTQGQLLSQADAIVTVHGTIALEATSMGIPVICSDNTYFKDWGICTHITSKSNFLETLKSIHLIPKPSQLQVDLAATLLHLAISPHTSLEPQLSLPADHLSPFRLYWHALNLVPKLTQSHKHIQSISQWLWSDSHSYLVYRKVNEAISIGQHA